MIVLMTKPFPARLHVYLARDNPLQGVILRRGPAKQVACIGWDRSNDTFKLGQWLKGRIYEYECDLSPDGRYFLYAAMDKRASENWTALSKVPYLTALDLSFNPVAILAGGLFMSNKTYWVNYPGYTTLKSKFKHSPLTAVVEHPNAPKVKRWNELYLYRLQRDGWSPINPTDRSNHSFSKPVNQQWQLVKIVHMGHSDSLGHGYIHESHLLVDPHNKQEINLPIWEWADLDHGRLVFSEQGKLCALPFTQDTLDINAAKVLHDFTPMVFEEIKAPYAKNKKS